jgi:methylmalonyl-CoA mutase
VTLDTLLADFPLPDAEAWPAALTRELRGADPARLAWNVAADVTLPPFLRADDAEADAPLLRRLEALLPALPPEANPWSEATEQAGLVDERRYSEAGAEPIEALVLTLSRLADALEKGAAMPEVLVGVGPSVLLEAARLRALRLLAARVQTAFGHAPDVRLHAVTSRFWMTRAAPHSNLLRATLGAFAAFLGQADVLTVRPHDLLGGAPSAHARRMGDNVHPLLVHEGRLTKAFGSGAYSLDVLTARLARTAWARFQQDSRPDPDAVRERLARQAAQTQDAVASGRLQLVGTNAYASPDDRIGVVPEVTLGDLPVQRAAVRVEALRAAVEGATASRAPDVALLRFGDPALSSARAAFARGLLAVAGVAARETSEAAEAARARLVILCSSDEGYAQEGASMAGTLGGAAPVALAGPDDALTPDLRAAGVAANVHARMPLLDAVRTLLGAAGVAVA